MKMHQKITKMICGFIKQQNGRIHKQGPSKSNPHPPSTRKISCFLFLHLLGKSKTKQDLSCTLLSGWCIQSFQTLIDSFKLLSATIILKIDTKQIITFAQKKKIKPMEWNVTYYSWHSTCAARTSTSFSNLNLSSSQLITAWSEDMSDASISRVRWKISIWSGMGSSRHPIEARRVDFPQPLSPSKPYRLWN